MYFVGPESHCPALFCIMIFILKQFQLMHFHAVQRNMCQAFNCRAVKCSMCCLTRITFRKFLVLAEFARGIKSLAYSEDVVFSDEEQAWWKHRNKS